MLVACCYRVNSYSQDVNLYTYNSDTQISGGSRILKRGVRINRCVKSGKKFCLTTPTFSETTIMTSIHCLHMLEQLRYILHIIYQDIYTELVQKYLADIP